MVDERRITREIGIQSTPEMAFEALTKASELREWFSDEARTDPRPGGRFEVVWNPNFRAEGNYTLVEAPHRVAFTWRSGVAPAETTVEATVRPEGDGVRVQVVHSGYGEGSEWDVAFSESDRGWEIGLENLKSTLETGIDQRAVRRPYMGIYLDILTAERAAKEGIAAEAGIYINSTVEGSPAQASGLVKGDVIVSMGGTATPGYQELGAALSAHRAGDVLAMEVVRGQERKTLEITLGTRPLPDIPATAEELASRLAEIYREGDAALQAALVGVTDDEAGKPPAAGEWSVKEVLAHLSIVERDQHCYLSVFALDGWLDTGPTNPSVIAGRIAAVLSVDPRLDDMLDRFLTDEAETVAYLRGLPVELLQHKARFRRIALQMVQLPEHTREHLGQIKATISAVRG